MRQDKKLILGMALLFFITFVTLGTLVVTEKLAPFYTDKIEKKFINYINKNYKDEKENFKIGKITYKATVYKVKVTNKNNKDLYFTMTYQNKKIKSTYKKDYLEGKTLLNKTKTNLEKKIKKNLNIDAKITFPLTLNKYIDSIKEDIINNENTNIYNIEYEITNKLSLEEIPYITNEISKITTSLNDLNITPNYTTISIKGNNKSLTLKNLTNKTLQSNYLNQIITNILTDNNLESLKENNLSYEYKEYGDD